MNRSEIMSIVKKLIIVCALFVVGCLQVGQAPVESESMSTQGLSNFCDGHPRCNPVFCVSAQLPDGGGVYRYCGSGFNNCASVCPLGMGGYCPEIEAGDVSRCRGYCRTIGLPDDPTGDCVNDCINGTQHECRTTEERITSEEN